jgi:hypothetical protein
MHGTDEPSFLEQAAAGPRDGVTEQANPVFGFGAGADAEEVPSESFVMTDEQADGIQQEIERVADLGLGYIPTEAMWIPGQRIPFDPAELPSTTRGYCEAIAKRPRVMCCLSTLLPLLCACLVVPLLPTVSVALGYEQYYVEHDVDSQSYQLFVAAQVGRPQTQSTSHPRPPARPPTCPPACPPARPHATRFSHPRAVLNPAPSLRVDPLRPATW